MGRKRIHPEKVPTADDFEFNGGPKDGMKIRMVWPPQKIIRFGMPTWSRYEYSGGKSYLYRDDEPPTPRDGKSYTWEGLSAGD